MVGGISEAYYGIPRKLRNKALKLISKDLRNILIKAYERKKLVNEKEEEERN